MKTKKETNFTLQEKLLLNTKEVQALIGLHPETAMRAYPNPMPGPVEIARARRLWRRKDVEKWVDELENAD